jgi:hypothetical protein
VAELREVKRESRGGNRDALVDIADPESRGALLYEGLEDPESRVVSQGGEGGDRVG